MGNSAKAIRVAAADAPTVEAVGEWGSSVWLANKTLTGSCGKEALTFPILNRYQSHRIPEPVGSGKRIL
jgi:hypothetical protein